MVKEEKLYLFGLALIPGLGPKRIKKMLAHFGNSKEAWEASICELLKIEGIGKGIADKLVEMRVRLNLEEEWQKYNQAGIKILTLADRNYPEPLASIYDPPPVLFIKGNYLPEDRLALAVVGSRRHSHYGKKVCQDLVRELVLRGFTIVSGFARGIDTIAHKQALKQGGRTIAVLGSGLDVIYPPENLDLYREVWKNGCVISEFPLGREPLKQNFPLRNRVLSGLSLGTIVIEASRRSGSLITANWALEQGREVFAVPGDIYRIGSAGTNNLIKAGAKMVTGIEDILEEFPAINFSTVEDTEEDQLEQAALPFLTPEENQIYQLVTDIPIQIEEIIRRTSIQPGRVISLLLGLELKGVVRELPGKHYVRNI